MQRLYSLVASVFVLTVLLVGCGERAKTAKGGPDKKQDEKKDDHSGWWCAEHGVPEEKCSLCLDEAKVKKMFKDKGDWCKIHDRAQSQCFLCDPSKFEAFEKEYIAKFNKKPPSPDPEHIKQ